ncbi:DNA-processing protein DprA [Bacillus massiliigorillae]|uniref:DNA-processing protein DprA n=1 Tax=Bacillus massiliigorillae TaxID=1243664 RepID=UPI0003A962D6|nr:DNA-processing protein DprA [Bacillus massiliigorillae]
MQECEKRLILLHHCRGIGWKSIKQILQIDRQLHTIFTRSIHDWQVILPKLSFHQLTLFYEDLHTISIDKKIKEYHSNSIIILTIFNDDYPERLKHIYNPPWVLYMKGNRNLLYQERILAIVGARKPSQYGLDAMISIIPRLINAGYVIVSGLASGIDTGAHQSAIQSKGNTIAVLGGGLYHIYPRGNTSLAMKMMKEQLVLTETPPMQKSEPWMFPLRNRIISGLSDGVFIIEAKERSGSLITASQALEQGREVFALPGNINSKLSIGTNKLIQEGAKLVLTDADIINELPYKMKH